LGDLAIDIQGSNRVHDAEHEGKEGSGKGNHAVQVEETTKKGRKRESGERREKESKKGRKRRKKEKKKTMHFSTVQLILSQNSLDPKCFHKDIDCLLEKRHS
jgi:hypothetical protein